MGIALHDFDDSRNVDLSVIFVPAIIVRNHRDRRVTNLGLARELGFRHVGHANDIAAPRTIQLAFGAG